MEDRSDWTHKFASAQAKRRDTCAAEIAAIAKCAGAQALISNDVALSPRAVEVNIRLGDEYETRVSFNGDSRTGAWVLPWFKPLNDHDLPYPPGFPGSVNPFHKRKATAVCYSFGELQRHVAQALACLAEHMKERD